MKVIEYKEWNTYTNTQKLPQIVLSNGGLIQYKDGILPV